MHPDVKALVYVAAVQPDVGESLSDLADKIPPAAKSIEPVGDGFLAVNPDAFPNDFAADAPEPVARFMAISQVPVSGDALKAKATVAAWKQKPSYAVIPMQDRMINPDLERFMTASPQCRAPGEASRLLCTASSIPSGRLRDLEVHCAHSEGLVEAKELRIRHVGRRGPSRVRAQAGRDRRHGALVFQRLRRHRFGSAAQEARHPSAHRHRTNSPYLHRSDRSLCR
jgi:hypothetical protein